MRSYDKRNEDVNRCKIVDSIRAYENDTDKVSQVYVEELWMRLHATKQSGMSKFISFKKFKKLYESMCPKREGK